MPASRKSFSCSPKHSLASASTHYPFLPVGPYWEREMAPV